MAMVMATKAPTTVTNPDGSTSTTTYDANGGIYVVTTAKVGPDGSRTESRQFASGETTQLKYDSTGKFLGALSKNPDGTYTLTDPKTNAKTTYAPDGQTPVNRVSFHEDGSRTTDYLNPDGSVNRSESITAKQSNTDIFNKEIAQQQSEEMINPTFAGNLKNSARSIKEALDQFDPLSTPGVNDTAFNGRVFGGKGADDPLFDNSGVGKVLSGLAGFYGLNGLTDGSGGTTGPGGAGPGGVGGAGGVDTAAITAAAAASKALQDKFLAEYNAAHPSQPPAMTAAQLPPAAQAEMVAQIKAAQASQLDPISAAHAHETLLDPTLQGQQRGLQLGLEGTLQDAIDGKAPSVAELQLRAAEQRQEANQLGLASRASGGGNVALALRTAANNIGRLNQGSSSDAAILRAKEIADARAQLGGVLDQTRGADISLADKNASLATHVSETNAGLDTNATLEAARLEAARRASNATLSTNTAMKDAELEAARRAANAKEINDRNANQGTLDTTAAANNLNAGLHQQEIDAAAKDAAAKNALTAGGQVITGTVGAADAQARAIAAAQAAKAAADAKQAAGIGALSSTVAAWLNSGKKTSAGGGYTSPVDIDYDKPLG